MIFCFVQRIDFNWSIFSVYFDRIDLFSCLIIVTDAICSAKYTTIDYYFFV